MHPEAVKILEAYREKCKAAIRAASREELEASVFTLMGVASGFADLVPPEDISAGHRLGKVMVAITDQLQAESRAFAARRSGAAGSN